MYTVVITPIWYPAWLVHHHAVKAGATNGSIRGPVLVVKGWSIRPHPRTLNIMCTVRGSIFWSKTNKSLFSCWTSVSMSCVVKCTLWRAAQQLLGQPPHFFRTVYSHVTYLYSCYVPCLCTVIRVIYDLKNKKNLAYLEIFFWLRLVLILIFKHN
jgi:hypothetical protein